MNKHLFDNSFPTYFSPRWSSSGRA